MVDYLTCKVFYITFALNSILGQVFPDLLEQIILLCTEMICLIFKCLLLAVVGLESILFSLAFLFLFICVCVHMHVDA